MTTSLKPHTNTSSTNFDLLSLHVLCDEIHAVLKDAESHLCQFYDDRKQAVLLLDSSDNLKQLGSIFALIAFDGADLLADALSKIYHQLSQHADNRTQEDETLMTDVSEGVMMLERYVEFVLLKEVPEPALLLPIINKIYAHLNHDPISVETLRQNSSSVIISDPAANYVSLSKLNLPTQELVSAYRAGLNVILEHKENVPLDQSDEQKLEAMAKTCALIAAQSDSLFWQAATTLTKDIAKDLPLSHAKKRTLIYLEQQFCDYLPIEDRRFAELVSFACDKDANFATLANQKYTLNQISQTKFEQMQRFLFGPNHEITSTLNTLIQEQIESIKQKIDTLVRADQLANAAEQITTNGISDELLTLSRTMYLLELNDASQALLSAANLVNSWQNPTLEELDTLLDKLMVAENAAIYLAKTHTPGAVKLPLHNRDISLHRLDTAYNTLVQESRNSLATLSNALASYIADDNRELLNLQNTPEMIRQVAGAAAFLRMSAIAKQLSRLANRLEAGLLQKLHDASGEEFTKMAAAWADVLVAADIEFENFAKNRPSSKQTLLVSEHSLNRLLVEE